MSADPKPIAQMGDSEIVAAAKAKLRELVLHDLRHWMASYVKVTAGSGIEGGAPDYRETRNHIFQLLSQLAMAQSNTGE